MQEQGGTQGRQLTSPSPRSRLLPARLQPPGPESGKPALCRVRRSATAQGPREGGGARLKGAERILLLGKRPPVRSREAAPASPDLGATGRLRDPGLRAAWLPGDRACCPRARAAWQLRSSRSPRRVYVPKEGDASPSPKKEMAQPLRRSKIPPFTPRASSAVNLKLD